jgi:hypothetical protein
MATTPSDFSRFQPSVLPSLAGHGLRVTLGAPVRPANNRQPSSRAAVLAALAKEPEDARLTGGTRSLDRRLLALNLPGMAKKVKTSAEMPGAVIRSTAA